MENISTASPTSPVGSPAFDNTVRKRRRVFDPALEMFKKNSAERTTILKQMLDSKNQPLSGPQHFFAGICDSVGKLPPIRQAELKIEITALVGRAEIEDLKAQEDNQPGLIYYVNTDPTITETDSL